MKNFYKVSNTIENGPRMDRKRTVVGPMKDRVKSRISPINHRLWTVIAPMLFVAFGLFGVNEEMWAGTYYATCRVISQPTEGGVVSIWQSAQEDDTYSFEFKTDDTAGPKGKYTEAWNSSATVDFFAYQKTNAGYTFKGWSTDINASAGSTSQEDHKYGSWWSKNCKYYPLSITSNSKNSNNPVTVIYYAIFKANEYKITLNKQSGTGGANEITVTYNASTNLTSGVSTPSRSGYVFKGYYTEANGGGTQLIDANGDVIARAGDSDTYTDKDKKWKYAGGVTLYACWKAKYTITFNAHGGSEADSKVVVSGDKYGELPSTTRSGYTFAGWYTAETGGSQVTSTTTVSITANQTLHAHWLAHYSVAFNANGGSGNMTAQGFVQGTAQNLKANTFTRTGYTFAGWATSADGNVVYSNQHSVNNLSSTGNATFNLFAKWTPNTYYVSFNGNGSTSGSVSNQTFSYDEAKSLSSNTYVKSYTVTFNGNSGTPASSELTATAPFLGWATSENGDKVYNDKQSVSNLTSSNGATVPLYAKWGTGSITLPTATRSAYHLDGWYIGDTKVGDAGQAYTPTSNVTLVAHWTQSQLATSFNGSDQNMNVDDVQNSAFTLSNAPSAQVHIEVTSIDDVTDGSGLVIEYNAATNTITARNAGVATIYFTQEETEYVTGGTSAPWTYTVTKKDPSFTGSAYNGLKVDDVQEADYSYSNVSASAPSASSSDNFYYTIDDVAFAKSAKNKGNNLVTYNPSTKEITACNAGTGKITLHQKETYKYNAGSKSFNVTVSKYDPSFTGSAYNGLKVEEVQTVDYSSSNTSSAKPSASSSDAFYYTIDVTSFANESLNKGTDLATYDAASNTLTPKNAGTGSVTFHQSETYKYNLGSQSFGITIGKWDNAIYVKGNDSYSTSTSLAGVISGVTLTATNTDYTNSPFEVEQTEGDNVALYDKSAQTITAIGTAGTATWTVHQDENYKYLEADNTFNVEVANAPEATDCYVLNEPSQRTSTQTFDLDARGKTLFIDFRRSWGDTSSKIKIIGISSSGEEEIDSPEWDDNWTRGKSYDISSKNYTQIKIELSGGVNTKYYENLKVTRLTYLNIGTDQTGSTPYINKTLTINKKADGVSAIYPGEKGQQATTVYWGIANGGNLKIKCDDSRFTFSQNTITGVDCNSGTTEITVYFKDTVAGIVTATATVYNDVYNRTFTLKGIIEKAKQPVTWNYNVVRYNDTITDAVSATVSPVTYESANPNIIKVIKDDLNQNTILVAVDTGTVNITAHVPGNTYFASVDTVHAIKVTMKQLQTIVWNQSLFDLESGGDNRTLTATATSDVEGCISTRLVEYVSSNSDVVYIAPGTNVLQIKGVGTATVTAFQRGGWDIDGHEYDSVAVQKTAIVRDPNAPCDNFVYQQPSEYTFGSMGNLVSTETKSSTEIDFGGKVAGESSIYFKGIKRGLTQYYGGTMSVEQYLPAASPHWQTVKSIGTPSTDDYDSVHFVFSREATKMRVTVTNAKGEHVFRDCRIKQARFIETTTPAKFNLNVGASEEQTIYLSYSNVVGNISFTLGQENSSFSVNRTIITDTCGGHAKNVAVVITYNPQHEVQNEQDVLTISDGTTSCEVILRGSATRVGRTITWNHADVRSIYTVEKDTLIAEARTSLNALAGTVEFTYVNNTSTANGSIDANNILSFTSAGTAYVVANTPNHDYYYPAATVGPKRWDVALTPTEVVEAPTIGSVVSGTALSDITVSGGTARNTINQGSVSGTFTVQNGNVTDVGPNKPVTVKFTPEDETMYDVCTYNMYIEVTQRPATDEEIGTVTAGHITFGEKLSDAVLSMNGTLNGHGTLVMTDPQKDEVKDVDTYENLKVLFTPGNTNIAPKELTVSVTVDKANPAVTPQATDITYGQPISASNITTASGDVAGSWAWAVDDTQVLSVGDHVLKANFTSASANYNNLSNVDVTLKVKKIEKLEVEVPLSFCAGESETFHGETYTTAGTDQINAVGATRDTVYNVTVTVLQPTTGTDSKTITVGDNESWHGNDLSGYAVGSYEVEYHTTNVAGCDSTVTLSLTVNAVVPVGPNTFTGNGEWENPSNWSTGIVPTTAEPDIIVVGQLVINEEKTVGGLTIMPTGGVTIVDDGKLTVNGTTTTQTGGYGDIHVKDDGALALGNSADLQVRDFMLDASLGNSSNAGTSGQVSGEVNLHINRDAYFQMSFDPLGYITLGWYDMTVPFEVEVLNGIYDNHMNKLTNGVDYLVMAYDETRRASSGRGWASFTGTMQPGRIYTITLEETKTWNTFVFKKKSGSTTLCNGSFAAEYTNAGETDDRGWNGIGNGTLQHRELTGLSGKKVQVYNHAEKNYESYEADEKAYAVGTAFFLQADAYMSSISLTNTDGSKSLHAPKYSGRSLDEFRLTLTAEGADRYADRIWVSASEETTDEYVIGHDLLKMGAPTEAKKAQMWTVKNGKNLCDVEATLVNDEATTPLNLYAPNAGQYTLAIDAAPEDATLYLTYNGNVIWDLTASPYVLDLTKGTTTGYGLRIVAANAPQITTGVEDVQGDGAQVRKVIIDNKMYIITPEGAIFDAIGKKVQ